MEVRTRFSRIPGKSLVNPQAARIDSWKEIAVHFGRSERTVRRWEKREGLPVHRLMHEKLGTVYAYARELDAWRESKDQAGELQEPEKLDAMPRPARTMESDTKAEQVRPLWAHTAGVLLTLALIGAAMAGMMEREHLAWKAEGHSPSSIPDSATGAGESISPDGKRIAFSSLSPNQDNLDLYVRSAGAGKAVRLTQHPAPDHHPAWSPDGSWIAFLRDVNGLERAILLIPASGGDERELARINLASAEVHSLGWPILLWSADGKWLFTVDTETANARAYAIGTALHGVAGTGR
jgi:WD40 repeat protein/helix-turn-helix protein